MMRTTWCKTDIEWAISDQLRSPLRHWRKKQQIVNIETGELTPTFPIQTSKIPILSLPASTIPPRAHHFPHPSLPPSRFRIAWKDRAFASLTKGQKRPLICDHQRRNAIGMITVPAAFIDDSAYWPFLIASICTPDWDNR